jgi:uncharacterized protein involved in exopolysaccharide biosynthesis
MKTWGDVFNAAKHRGEDPSYAAFLADEWEKRRKRMPEKLERENDRLYREVDALNLEIASLRRQSGTPGPSAF